MDTRFFGEFDTKQDVESFFRERGCLDGCEVIFASYSRESYSGRAEVIYRGPDGQLYEVTGSHCSCYGLEGQWSPDVVTVASLRMRPVPSREDYQYRDCTDEELDALRRVFAGEV